MEIACSNPSHPTNSGDFTGAGLLQRVTSGLSRRKPNAIDAHALARVDLVADPAFTLGITRAIGAHGQPLGAYFIRAEEPEAALAVVLAAVFGITANDAVLTVAVESWFARLVGFRAREPGLDQLCALTSTAGLILEHTGQTGRTTTVVVALTSVPTLTSYDDPVARCAQSPHHVELVGVQVGIFVCGPHGIQAFPDADILEVARQPIATARRLRSLAAGRGRLTHRNHFGSAGRAPPSLTEALTLEWLALAASHGEHAGGEQCAHESPANAIELHAPEPARCVPVLVFRGSVVVRMTDAHEEGVKSSQ